MFKCHVCSSTECHVEYVNEFFEIGDKFYLVENIPATVCSRCGEEIFSCETSEAIRVIKQRLHWTLHRSHRLFLLRFPDGLGFAMLSRYSYLPPLS